MNAINVNKFAYIYYMSSSFEKYKGIHPGKIIDRELKKRSIRQRPFSLSINEHPQTFNAITKGKRRLNIPLSLKIEKELDLEEGTLSLLQTYYDIQEEKKKLKNLNPNLSILRKSLFWDTDFGKIDWEKQYIAVVQRVFERGNEEEKNEVLRFYGADKVQKAIDFSKQRSSMTSFSKNEKTK